MVARTRVDLYDDLDGSLIEESKGSAVSFTFDGVTYEMDLSDANQQKLRDAVAPFQEKARKVRGTSTRPAGKKAAPAPAASVPPADVDPGAVRRWAEGKGIEVSNRGRLSKELVQQYRDDLAKAS